MSIHTSTKINWISVLQGMAIVLVVMNHVRLYDASIGDDYAFVHQIRDVFQPYFMATFFFISGMLLYYSRMSGGWRTVALYRDKAARLVVPLLFCTVLGCASQAVFNGVVKHPKEIGVDTLLYALLDYDTTPWPHRWYLVSLVWMMVLYPCYLYISDRGVKAEVIAVAAVIAVYLVDLTDWVDTNLCYLFTLNKYLPFFVLGIITYKYGLYRYLRSFWAACSCWTLYCAIYMLMPHVDGETPHVEPWWLLMSVTGVMAITSTSMIISERMPQALSSIRNYVFPIYLFGIAFQAFVELILWRRMGCPDGWVYAFYVLNILVGLYLPVLMSKVIERIPYRWLRRCFGLS